MASTELGTDAQEQEIKDFKYQKWTKHYSPAEVESRVKSLVQFRNEQIPNNPNWGNKTGIDSESDEEIEWAAHDYENLNGFFGPLHTKRGIRFRVNRHNSQPNYQQ
eukprot:2120368-Heterocapsa_arctica.AAC.1